MNKEKQKTVLSRVERVVPKLRFPEFENNAEWKTDSLIDIATFSKGKNISKKDIVNGGKLFCVRYGELYTDYNEVIDEVISKTNLPTEDLVLSEKDDIIIPSSGETRIDIARASCVLREGIALGGDLNIIRSNINGVFFSYYLNSAKKKTIAKMAQGVSVMHLYNSQLERLEIEIPSPEEQQKIANCLLSLDNLITAESEKLDHLKDHKTGLLQQLFPAKGETKPQFRFPEFENDGDWETPLFSKYIRLYRGSSPRPINQFLTNDENGVNWIKIGDTKNAVNQSIYRVEQKITIEGSKKSRKVSRGELILANSMSYGATYELELDGCIYDGWFVLREYEECFDKQYLLQLLNSDILQKQYKRLAAGGIVQNISSEIVYNTTLPKPSNDEQQKIANCLYSADDLIQSQRTKIEALKAHKKGLMQQLFPNVNSL